MFHFPEKLFNKFKTKNPNSLVEAVTWPKPNKSFNSFEPVIVGSFAMLKLLILPGITPHSYQLHLVTRVNVAPKRVVG